MRDRASGRPGRFAELSVADTMPPMTGLQVLRELKQMNPDVRIVFSSGYAMDSDTDQLLAAGARAFVSKPYRPRELVQAVRGALEQG